MKLESSRHIFEKYWCIRLHKNPSSGRQVVPRGQADKLTDRPDEANSHFSQFPNAPKNVESNKYGAMTLLAVLYAALPIRVPYRHIFVKSVLERIGLCAP
jgi:hypothetical protein